MSNSKIENKSVPGIYAIYRVGTDDCYVGQSVNIRMRWNTHRQDFKKHRHASKHMQRIFDKHGEGVFEFRVLEGCHINDLVDREQFWVDQLKPKYNSCAVAGSCLGYKHSEETREKHRRHMIGNKNALGSPGSMKDKRHSHETIAKISASKTGKPSGRKGFRHTPETIEKISRNRRGIPSKYKGIPATEEFKQKVSRACLAAWATLRQTQQQGQQELPL